MKRIESFTNPYVKFLKSLKNAKGRKETGQFLVEGIKLTQEAAGSSMELTGIIKAESFLLPEAGWQAGREIIELPDRVFDSVCDTRTPQGIAAVVRIPSITRLRFPDSGTVLLLEDVQDPGNVGTMIRTADAAGVKLVLLSAGCADVYSPKVVRSTMGSLFHLPVVTNLDAMEAIRSLKEEQFFILSGDLSGEGKLPRLPSRVAILIGNEGKGLSREAILLSDFRYRLPIVGKAESLNASVACGIILYDILRAPLQRELLP